MVRVKIASMGTSAMRLVLFATLVVTPSVGSPTVSSDGVTPAERVTLDPGLIPTLLQVPLGGSIRVVDWPLEPGRRGDMLLRRRDVYAPGAVIRVMDGGASREAPRSTLAFLFGEVAGDEATRVLVSVDPQAMRLHAFTRTPEGWTELRRIEEERPDDYLLAPSPGFLDPSMQQSGFACGQPELPEPPEDPSFPLSSAAPGTEAPTALRQVTLAVDTDNELMSLKFSDDTASAANYIASLIALMSVIYERDLEVRFLQGTTTLRVSTTADPYAQSGTGNADSAKLTEFKNYWVANYGGVSRAAAMMLSGKQLSPNSASGIGYVNTLCSTTGAYTFSQVFKFAGSTASSDVKLVAHEIGHNFGSSHTHCYLNPTPIDTCYSGESGCYSGPTSCPAPQTINGVANVRGTLMSYCHLLSGCSSSSVFHPRTVALLDPIVDSKVGVCVFPVDGGNPKEASPFGTMTAQRGTGGAVSVTYAPACGATEHTVYAGNLATLGSGGIAWSQRFCSLGASGGLSFTPSGDVYFVVVGNNGTTEGSCGLTSTGERPAAGSGGACSYLQDLSGTCP
jgi:hypothetical protein